jgi:RNA polymerase sigma-70 factor (ECF subfamily)
MENTLQEKNLNERWPGMKNSNYAEHEVVHRLKAGDLQALNELMNQHKDEFYRLAYRILGNKEDAEEILQDTFLRAYQKIASYEGKAKLSTWLYRICVNRCLNRLESRKTRAAKMTGMEEIQNLPDLHDTVAEYEAAEWRETINHAVDRLKPDQRILISLYYLQAFSCAEISDILQQPLGTVKTHLFRARNSLKKILADAGLNQEA